MSDPLSDARARLVALTQGRAPNADAFPPSSRYHGIEVALWIDADGVAHPYVRRRFLPAAHRFALLHLHVVRQEERPDHIASAELGDPEQFWLLCDANNVMRPAELAEVGRALRITLPADVPGPEGADR
jgi:hypothetical protein